MHYIERAGLVSVVRLNPKMASFGSIFFFLMALFFSLSSSLLSSASLANAISSPFATNTNTNTVPSQKKVTLSLYYESLCPYCSDFIVNGLVKAVTTDLINIIDLRLIPWGNAVLQKTSNTVVCQHGEDECYLNIVHACAIFIWPDLITHFNFIRCLEGYQALIKDDPGKTIINGHSKIAEDSWKNCTIQLKLDLDRIGSCVTDGTGQKLVLQNGEETDKLNPPHEFVPWVVVGRRPLMAAYNSFAEVVCRTYRGDQTPSACQSAFSSREESIQSVLPGSNFPHPRVQNVCYKN